MFGLFERRKKTFSQKRVIAGFFSLLIRGYKIHHLLLSPKIFTILLMILLYIALNYNEWCKLALRIPDKNE